MIETSRYAGIVIIIEPNRHSGVIYTKPSRCAWFSILSKQRV